MLLSAPQKRGALLLGLTETGVTSNQKYSPEIQEALRMAELMELDSEGTFIPGPLLILGSCFVSHCSVSGRRAVGGWFGGSEELLPCLHVFLC